MAPLNLSCLYTGGPETQTKATHSTAVQPSFQCLCEAQLGAASQGRTTRGTERSSMLSKRVANILTLYLTLDWICPVWEKLAHGRRWASKGRGWWKPCPGRDYIHDNVALECSRITPIWMIIQKWGVTKGDFCKDRIKLSQQFGWVKSRIAQLLCKRGLSWPSNICINISTSAFIIILRYYLLPKWIFHSRHTTGYPARLPWQFFFLQYKTKVSIE